MRPRNSEDHSKHWIIWLNMTHFWCQIHDWLARLELLQATFCHQPEMLHADAMCLLSNGDQCDQRAFFRAIHRGGSPTTSCAWHTDELVGTTIWVDIKSFTTILERLQKRWLVLQGKHFQITCVWCSRISNDWARCINFGFKSVKQILDLADMVEACASHSIGKTDTGLFEHMVPLNPLASHHLPNWIAI